MIDLNAKQSHSFVAPAYKRETLSDSIGPGAWPDNTIDLAELFA